VCGICGVFSLEGQLDPRVSRAVPAMTETLARRGPDGHGFLADTRAALGHRRLSIIDRAGGAQPMSNEDGTCWVVFNGEIYNHHAVRSRLIGLGHQFRTVSDTETIVHAYEEFGAGCLEHLDGMFAFALYDQRAATLFLARDRLGKKPLFYATFGGVLHFASEIKALTKSPYWDGSIDLGSLEGYLSLGYFVAPDTPFKGVRKLPPAHWLMASNGRISVSEYWDITSFDGNSDSQHDTLVRLDTLMADAVRDRLESEVPLGAFLSGGIDSGLVVTYMSDASPTPPVTVTVGFDDAAHNELTAAELTARQCRSEHHPHVLHPTLDEVLEPLVAAFDEPFADSSAVPTYYLCQAAREHVTVALSGDGGDETFAGYDFRYMPERVEGVLRGILPPGPGQAASRALASIWPRSRRLPRALRLAALFENLGGDAEEGYYADLCFLHGDTAREVLGASPRRDRRDSPVYESVVGPFRRCSSPSLLQKVQYADLKVYLPNDPLVKVDRMSMWHSLEVRCPLLDRRVVEFAFSLPVSRKMPGLKGKRLLRELARKRLPAGLSKLPKRGFSAPVGAWLAGPFATAFRDEVLAADSFVGTITDRARVRGLFESHQSAQANHGYVLWALWMLERWHTYQAGLATKAAVEQPA
jgi:asparagine synthase (glutamine-hydrolysing)